MYLGKHALSGSRGKENGLTLTGATFVNSICKMVFVVEDLFQLCIVFSDCVLDFLWRLCFKNGNRETLASFCVLQIRSFSTRNLLRAPLCCLTEYSSAKMPSTSINFFGFFIQTRIWYFSKHGPARLTTANFHSSPCYEASPPPRAIEKVRSKIWT